MNNFTLTRIIETVLCIALASMLCIILFQVCMSIKRIADNTTQEVKEYYALERTWEVEEK